jgi:hypothetical protein
MKDLEVRVSLRSGEAAAFAPKAVTVSFSMPGMKMPPNRAKLAATKPGVYEGKAVLVECASGRRDWIADVELTGADGAAQSAHFALTIPEEERR